MKSNISLIKRSLLFSLLLCFTFSLNAQRYRFVSNVKCINDQIADGVEFEIQKEEGYKDLFQGYYKKGETELHFHFRSYYRNLFASNFLTKISLQDLYYSKFSGIITERGFYNKSVKVGEWTKWSKAGVLKQKFFYPSKTGAPMVENYYYANGSLHHSFHYYGMEKRIEKYFFYDTGQLKVSMNEYRGRLNGEVRSYHRNGQSMQAAIFDKGKFYGTQTWDDQGRDISDSIQHWMSFKAQINYEALYDIFNAAYAEWSGQNFEETNKIKDITGEVNYFITKEGIPELIWAETPSGVKTFQPEKRVVGKCIYVNDPIDCILKIRSGEIVTAKFFKTDYTIESKDEWSFIHNYGWTREVSLTVEDNLSSVDPLSASMLNVADTIQNSLPRYIGGHKMFHNYVAERINHFSLELDKISNSQGVVSFWIMKDGSIGDVRIVQPVFAELDNEVINVFEEMPSWIPARIDGAFVEVRMSMTYASLMKLVK